MKKTQARGVASDSTGTPHRPATNGGAGSVERLQDVLACIGTALYVVDAKTEEYITLSPMFTTLLGYTLDDVAAHGGRRPFLQHLIVSDEVEEKTHGFSLIQDGQATAPIREHRIWCRHKDGSLRCTEDHWIPEYADGRLVRTYGILRDVTAQKETQDALIETEGTYRTLFDSIADPILIFEKQANRILDCNRAMLASFGYSHDQLRAMTPLDLVAPGEMRAAAEKNIDDEADTGAHEYVLLTRTGEEVPVETLTADVRYRGQDAWITILRDVTERKRLEREYRERAKELQAHYGLAEIAEREGISLGELYQELTNILPKSWQYPEIACARIRVGDREFRTSNFAESPWRQSAPVRVSGAVVGTMDVGYLDERPEKDEGPFLKEERLLINALAQRLGRITERKRAEEELGLSVARLKEAQRTARLGSWETNLATAEVIWSDELCRLFEIAPEVIHEGRGRVQAALVARIHPDDRARYEDAMAQSVSHNARYDVEYRIRGSDGSERYLHSQGGPTLDAAGNLVRLSGTVLDITERKQAEEQAKRFTAEIAAANEEIKQFAYIVSHDLRAPLVNLRGFSSELRRALDGVLPLAQQALTALPAADQRVARDAIEEDIPEALAFIDSSVTRMDSFINAVLKLSRIGRRDLAYRPLDPRPLVEEILRTLAHQQAAHDATVTVADLPHITADRTALEQIFGNLLANAILYLAPGRPGRIEVGGTRGKSETTFWVRDNGRGIAAGDADKVFAPFRRAGKQDVPGEGMGLSYVHTMVRQHGGRIWFESSPDVGTTFFFTVSNSLGDQGGSHAERP
jgi:PAS domain S-box-containing protein